MSNEIRRLKKGKQESASISNLIGRPTSGEGKNGDIQVRMTNRGPRLYAKLGNKWRTADLKDAELQNNVYIPKVWFWRGVSPANGEDLLLYLPDYISNTTILGVNVGISLGTKERTHFSLGNSAASAIYNMFVHYNKQYNYVRIENNASSGTSIANKDTHISVFFR